MPLIIGLAQLFTDGASVPVLGAKVYYADGTVTRHDLVADVAVNFVTPSLSLVVCVNIYFDRQYDSFGGVGKSEVITTSRYKKTLTQFDVYWFSPTGGFGAGLTGDPRPLDAIVKQGQGIPTNSDLFYSIYDVAFADGAW